MKLTITILQIIVAVMVSALVLIQAKGTGLGRTFGSATYHSKRGVEFVVFRATVVLAVVFVVISVVNQILS
jgi:protein translocase SecG subunit